MAVCVRTVCGYSRRRLRNERSAAGDLRIDAAVVGTAVSCDAAGVLSSREPHRHGGVSGDGPMGACRDAVLLAIAAARDSGDLAGPMGEPSSGGGHVLEILLRGSRGDRGASVDAGNWRASLSKDAVA